MRKKIYSMAAVAALASGAVWADAECQAGSAWVNKPGCTAPDQPPPATQSGGWTPQGYDPNQGWNAWMSQFPQAAQQSQIWQAQNGQYVYVDPNTGVTRSVRPNSRDRDGDGVRNNRDRYPDDPRYR